MLIVFPATTATAHPLKTGMWSTARRKSESMAPTSAWTLVTVRFVYLSTAHSSRWTFTGPHDGVGMKIWQCYNNLAAQTWDVGTDGHVYLDGKGLSSPDTTERISLTAILQAFAWILPTGCSPMASRARSGHAVLATRISFGRSTKSR